MPVWHAHARWVRAELARADAADTADDWCEVVAALEPLERPYDLARVRLRLAGALLGPGTRDDGRARATELLRLSRAAAEHLAARPLADAVALLARRARLPLDHAPGQPPRTGGPRRGPSA